MAGKPIDWQELLREYIKHRSSIPIDYGVSDYGVSKKLAEQLASTNLLLEEKDKMNERLQAEKALVQIENAEKDEHMKEAHGIIVFLQEEIKEHEQGAISLKANRDLLGEQLASKERELKDANSRLETSATLKDIREALKRRD